VNLCPVCGTRTPAPLLADWCSGAGGAGWGYHLAGFHIVGFDHLPQPRYPGCFVQCDVMDAPIGGFDAYHASPPCTDHRRNAQALRGTGWLLDAVRHRLAATGRPYVIENVPFAPLRPDYRLCGCMYGLAAGGWELRRERWFETSWHGFSLRPPCQHQATSVSVLRQGARYHLPRPRPRHHTVFVPQPAARALMGIGWMSERELGDAVPPAYTADIGADLMGHLEQVAA
jgi:hypothetical protein